MAGLRLLIGLAWLLMSQALLAAGTGSAAATFLRVPFSAKSMALAGSGASALSGAASLYEGGVVGLGD